MILILILLLSFFPNHKERFIDNTISQLFNTNKTTLSNQEYYIYSPNHEALIKTSIEIFKDNIFFGAGPKTFRYHCSDPKYMKQVEYWNIQKENIMKVDGCSSHPHNAYIQLMAETGLFGFTIIFSIFLYVLVNLIKIKKSDIGMQKSYESNIIVLCALFIIVFPFLPTGNFFNNYSSAYIFFIFGLYLFTFKKLTKLRKIIK